MRPEPYRPGQHVHCANGIAVICGGRDNRYGGSYTVRALYPRPRATELHAQSARTQEYLLAELAEAHLCRIPVGPQHACGLIHVPEDYRIETGVRGDRP
jgi:hypothetical protein